MKRWMKQCRHAALALLICVAVLCMLTACSSDSNKSVVEQLGASSSAQHVEALDACAESYPQYNSKYAVAYVEGDTTTCESLKKAREEEVGAVLKSALPSGSSYSTTVAIGRGKNRSVALDDLLDNYEDEASGAKYYGILDDYRSYPGIGVERYYIVVFIVK